LLNEWMNEFKERPLWPSVFAITNKYILNKKQFSLN
jgi:hypothetical protein